LISFKGHRADDDITHSYNSSTKIGKMTIRKQQETSEDNVHDAGRLACGDEESSTVSSRRRLRDEVASADGGSRSVGPTLDSETQEYTIT